MNTLFRGAAARLGASAKHPLRGTGSRCLCTAVHSRSLEYSSPRRAGWQYPSLGQPVDERRRLLRSAACEFVARAQCEIGMTLVAAESTQVEQVELLPGQPVVSNPANDAFNIVVSGPETITIRMVNAAALGEYEFHVYVACLLFGGFTGFAVPAI